MIQLSNEEAQAMIEAGKATCECCIGGSDRHEEYPHIILLEDESYMIETDEEIPEYLVNKLNQESQQQYNNAVDSVLDGNKSLV